MLTSVLFTPRTQGEIQFPEEPVSKPEVMDRYLLQTLRLQFFECIRCSPPSPGAPAALRGVWRDEKCRDQVRRRGTRKLEMQHIPLNIQGLFFRSQWKGRICVSNFILSAVSLFQGCAQKIL